MLIVVSIDVSFVVTVLSNKLTPLPYTTDFCVMWQQLLWSCGILLRLCTQMKDPLCTFHLVFGRPFGWIKMPLRMEVGLSSGYITLDGDPARVWLNTAKDCKRPQRTAKDHNKHRKGPLGTARVCKEPQRTTKDRCGQQGSAKNCTGF